MKKITFLLMFILLSCFSNKKTVKKINSEESLNKHDYKIFNIKDNIDLIELISSYHGKKSILDNPETFLYIDSKRKIRIAIYLNKRWHTWEIHDANNQEYYAKIEKVNFDNTGTQEIIIQSKYGVTPQSTFGHSYFGNFQIWNVDSAKLYFDIENYKYSDDMGRNGDQSYTNECFLNVDVMEKQLIVNQTELNTNIAMECYFDDELFGTYYLKNEIVTKEK